LDQHSQNVRRHEAIRPCKQNVFAATVGRHIVDSAVNKYKICELKAVDLSGSKPGHKENHGRSSSNYGVVASS
jgi:hypothetical protein